MHLDSEVLSTSLPSGRHALHCIDEETEAQKLEHLDHNHAAGYGENQDRSLLINLFIFGCVGSSFLYEGFL